MNVTDITPDFLAFWGRAARLAPDEQQRLWYVMYEDPHDDLLSLCGGRHGMPEALPAALERFPDIVPRLRDTIPMIQASIERTGPQIAGIFGLDQLDFPTVLLVGMFWSDGWVVEIAGHPTCFVAVEMIKSPLRANLLLPHEAAHIAHETCLGGTFETFDTLACALFREGLATLAPARVVPGHEETTYLWSGMEHTWQGLGMMDWLAQCEASWPLVRSRLLRDLASTDHELTGPYLLGDRAPPDQPSRVGYFVGFRLVSALAQEHALTELVRWPAGRVQMEITEALMATDDPPPRFAP